MQHRRRSIRLPGYDYTRAGAYFVTIKAHGHETSLGEIHDGGMHLNEYGKIVEHAWQDLPVHYAQVELGTFCIMPDHVHGIILLHNVDDVVVGAGAVVVGAGLRPAPTPTTHTTPTPTDPIPTNPRIYPLSEIVRAFKSFSARRINAVRQAPGTPVWQRNYYEHIIRSEQEYQQIHQYIQANPANWAENPRRR
ncbi:transposase [Levilinea saccharolytica]|uniref:Transposase IS200-like domain-containing protein n=1 Tax=Levilinea saccharolytica TaxID=229921 RepID=A0A0P6XE24_9CHLR|nr:transposase [Levilinea saccharolytica]KPL78468.1 hypothetical protein ADN01_14820 [Levilinea saccharolytica]GAP18498.1 transposase [Levilinea saccharolytica]